MKKNQRKTALIRMMKLAVTVFLFYLIFRAIEFDKFAATVSRVQWLYLAAPCALYVVGLLICSLRLQWLLQGYQMPIGLGAAFDLNWIAGFYNNFLPSSIGGDFYRIVYLNRMYPRQPAQVVSAVILDRGLGLLTMLIVGGMAGILFVGALISTVWVIAVLYSVAGLAIAVSLYVLFAEHNLRLSHTTRFPIVNKVINGLNILVAYPDNKALAYSLLISFVFLATIVISNYFLFLAFGTELSIPILLFAIPVINLAGMIPISINALGVTEGVGIVLFSHFGLEAELILSVFLTGRVLLILCSATGGLRIMFPQRALPDVPT